MVVPTFVSVDGWRQCQFELGLVYMCSARFECSFMQRQGLGPIGGRRCTPVSRMVYLPCCSINVTSSEKKHVRYV